MLIIDDLRVLCKDETIRITQHLQLRTRDHKIKYDDVINVIVAGEIIEQYPEDYPYPSCLVLGYTQDRNHLHVVCGVGNGILWLITAYFPDPNKWEKDHKTRKVQEL